MKDFLAMCIIGAAIGLIWAIVSASIQLNMHDIQACEAKGGRLAGGVCVKELK